MSFGRQEMTVGIPKLRVGIEKMSAEILEVSVRIPEMGVERGEMTVGIREMGFGRVEMRFRRELPRVGPVSAVSVAGLAPQKRAGRRGGWADGAVGRLRVGRPSVVAAEVRRRRVS